MEYVKLNNGVEMPLISFGVYQTIWNDEEETKKVTLLNCSIVDLPLYFE